MTPRSLLFVPGNRPDRFNKACESGADLVCIDLEDAVAPDEKAQARKTTLNWLAQTRHKHAGLRINATDNVYGEADLTALCQSNLALPFIMIPKAFAGAQIDTVADRLPQVSGAIFAVIESAKGVCSAGEIYAHPRVKYSIFGAIDYSADIGSDMEWDTMLYARSRLVANAKANGVTLFDTPYMDVRDNEGCMASTLRAKKIGIYARSAIHPAQIDPIHAAFIPSAKDIAHANRIIAAMDAAGGNVALLDGKLLEEPVVKKARRILESLKRNA